MKEEPRKTLFNDEIIRAAKPILFNGEMVRAIIEGRKTVTRRAIKTHIDLKTYNDALYFTEPYKPGDILYVRETWAKTPYGYIFRADGEEHEGRKPGDKWHPSIHMPKEAARIFLRVKYVYVARLQKSGEYLVTTQWLNGDIDVSLYEYSATYKEWNDGDMCGQKVIAWMPKPETYKPTKEGSK